MDEVGVGRDRLGGSAMRGADAVGRAKSEDRRLAVMPRKR